MVLTLESDAFVVTLIGSSLEEDHAVVQEVMRTVTISR